MPGHTSNLFNSGSVFPYRAADEHYLSKKTNLSLKNPMIFCPFGYRGLYWNLKINADSSCREPELRSDSPKAGKKQELEKAP
jgi:hypothetical protein